MAELTCQCFVTYDGEEIYNHELDPQQKAYLTGTPVDEDGHVASQVFDNNVYLGEQAGSLYATEFHGTLKGNADSATKATNDSKDQEIVSTYIKDLSITDNTITYTKGDDTTDEIIIPVTESIGDAGSNIQPVYISEGKSVACSYKLEANVPSDAKFTDTEYTLPAATSSELGGVKIGNNISVSDGTISLNKTNITTALGYTPSQTDTDTTYSAGSGISLSVDNKFSLEKDYAGGTKVTLNGSSKSSKEASFYAPTTFGAAGEILVSRGTSTAEPVWQSIYDFGISPSNHTHYYAGSSSIAGPASKAIADADGNNIGNTYLKLSGGTLTGNLTVNGSTYFKASCYMPNTVFYNSYNKDETACCLIGLTNDDDLCIGSHKHPHNGNTFIRSPKGLISFAVGSTDGSANKVIRMNEDGHLFPTNSSQTCGTTDDPWYRVWTNRLTVKAAKPTFLYLGTTEGTGLSEVGSVVTSAANCYVGTGGILSKTSNPSSRTIKHDIKDLEDESIKAERLYELPVHQAKYNADILDKNDGRYLKDMPMFIIEEMNEIYPIAVDMNGDNVKDWSWNERYLLPPMLKLIQDQKKEIDTLKEELKLIKESLNL